VARPVVAGLLAGIALTGLAAGCGGGSSPKAAPRTPPDLAAFLQLPVATPSACPSNVAGTTSGRRSPWVGHVDVSVFVEGSTPVVKRLGDTLRSSAGVATVYFESQRQAFEEFRRLYTCSAEVSPKEVRASYRLVLSASHGERDALIRRIRRLPGVADVSCDPSDPCTGAG